MMKESIINYNKQQMDNYLSDLRIVGSLSGLFSDNDVPFLHYRVTENIYCSSFNATNLARDDVTADAKLRTFGVGIKTFIEQNKRTFQKVAEFNSQVELYKDLNSLDKVKKIAELRNRRIQFTKDAYDLKDMIYHCVIRNKSGICLFEEKMFPVDINNIKMLKSNNHILNFTDGISVYKFNVSKSTLYKKFITKEYFAEVPVTILENPLEKLNMINLYEGPVTSKEILILPLYTYRKGTLIKIVPEKSGLNQWNAGGRQRNEDEVYIPFPADIRTVFDSYFPDRNTPFDVELPNGNILSMKICQDEGKAIMSNPNKALGKWLLRDVLKIPYGVLVTYQNLLEIGIDSVIFEKEGDKYKLDFQKIGSFEEFYNRMIIPDYE